MKRPRNNPGLRGFTFVELCISMVITALVLTALAAFSMATANAWEAGATTNHDGRTTVATIPVIATLASARLENEFASAELVGGFFAGNLTDTSVQQSSVLVWKNDSNNDIRININEIELIEYDPTDHTLYKWVNTATTEVVWGTFSGSAYIATFKTGATKTPLARNIDGMQINAINRDSASQYPLLEYRLYLQRGGQTQIRYGSVCVSAPTKATGMVLN